jgi:hypothetical protein
MADPFSTVSVQGDPEGSADARTDVPLSAVVSPRLSGEAPSTCGVDRA